MKSLLHETRIDIPKEDRIKLIEILNKTLASASVLQVQLKQAHWNIKGKQFIAVHKLLDELAEEIEDQVDVVAERVTSLGGTALGTLQQAVKNTALNEYPVDIFAIEDHIAHLSDNFAILGKLTRQDIKKSDQIGDMATNDLYIDLARVLDKSLWFLEAHLQS